LEQVEQHQFQPQLTTKYTPKQNGVAERKNKIIMDMVRCMLKAKQMPKEFLAKEVATTIIIWNNCPTESDIGDHRPQSTGE
jgi:hypothetical protein